MRLVNHPGSLFAYWCCGALSVIITHEPLHAMERDAAPPPLWWAQVQQHIAASEYEIHRSPGREPATAEGYWQAPNRAQGYRIQFTPEGPRLHPRMKGDREWTWGLAFEEYQIGSHPAQRTPAVQSMHASGTRFEYRRAGGIVEWYRNRSDGLEQGFEVSAPLETGDRLDLRFALQGDLQPTPVSSADRIDFQDHDGRTVLRYGGLRAWDASGKMLPSTLSVFHGIAERSGARFLQIAVDISSARFPISIDPIVTAPIWSVQGNQISEYFGCSVAGAGDVNGDGYSDILVGASGYDYMYEGQGRAFLFFGSADGPHSSPDWWGNASQLSASFGYSVASAGDVNNDGYGDVIVSAPQWDQAYTDEGLVYGYYGSASGLKSAPDWVMTGGQSNAWFGRQVAGAGDVNGDGYSDIIVGAWRYDHDGDTTEEGIALIYPGSAGGLASVPLWTANSGNQNTARFGASVAGAGDINGDGYGDVLVGAYVYDNGQSNEGRAFLYLGGPAGPSSTPTWYAESDQANANMGNAVAGAGDINGDGYADVLIGTNRMDTSMIDSGQVSVYFGSASGLPSSPSKTIPGISTNELFGSAVAGAGDINGDGYADILIGAYQYINGQANEGRAALYLGSNAGPQDTPAWMAEGNEISAYYGLAVNSAGDVNGDGYSDIIVGAPSYPAGSATQGRAEVFLGSASGLTAAAGWNAEGNQTGAWFGFCVAAAGDVNGDGYSDIAVGAPHFDTGTGDEGRAYVFHGAAQGPASTPAWIADGTQSGAGLGYAIAAAGDINGDGYGDLLVGEPDYQATYTGEGRAHLFLGSATGLNTVAGWTMAGGKANANLGQSLSSAGDVNGDGLADVLIGAPNYDFTLAASGRVFLFAGARLGLSGSPAWTASGEATGARFGFSLACAGDINGDTFSDVLIGAPGYSSNAGRVQAYLGSASGLSTPAAWTQNGAHANAWFGRCVAGAGDLNGDGFGDILAAEPFYANGQTEEGRVRAYYGSSGGLSAVSDWTYESNMTQAMLGYSMAGAGDINGDGFDDIAVGAPYFMNGQPMEGQVLAFHGSSGGLSPSPQWSAESNQDGAEFGSSVAAAGDVNGDGFADVFVGAPFYDGGQNDEGRVYVYYGNAEADRGLAMVPRQRRADNTASLAQGGRGDSPGSVRVAMGGRTPCGRGKVQLECEIKPSHVPFDGLSTVRSGEWLDTGVSGIAFNEILYSLTPDSGQHWRMRLRYWPSHAALPAAGRWYSLPDPLWGNVDFRTPAAPANAPDTPGAINIGLNTITWTWMDRSNNETGFLIWSDPGTSAPETLRTTTAYDVEQWTQNGLSINSQYAFQAAATNSVGQSPRSALFTAYTLADRPSAPILNHPGADSMELVIDPGDGNPVYTLYAIEVSPPVFGRAWVQSTGALGYLPLYQTSADWGIATITGLEEATAYAFRLTARNGAGVDTTPGPEAYESTLDLTPPSAVITLLDPSPTAANQVRFQVVFDESVGATFTHDDVMAAPDSLTGTIALDPVEPGWRYTVSVDLHNPFADGLVRILLASDGITDSAGNPCEGGSSDAYTIHNWPGFFLAPEGADLYVGESHTLRVQVENEGVPIAYQWKCECGDAPPANGPASPEWPLENCATTREGLYWCEVTYDGEPFSSAKVPVNVRNPVHVVEHPRGDIREVGDSCTFSVRAEDGYAPLTYLWTRNDIEVGDGEILTLNDLVVEDSGAYRAYVTDRYGHSAISNSAQLTVMVGLPAAGPVFLAAGWALLMWTGIRLAKRRR